MKKNLLWLVGLATLVFALVACFAAAGGLDATSWKLESYRDAAGNLVDILPRSVVTLNFQAEQVSGNASCNNYSGGYQTSGNTIEFGLLAVTEKACLQPLGIMEQEYAYLAALDAVTKYEIQGNTLKMQDERGDVILVFTPATGDS